MLLSSSIVLGPTEEHLDDLNYNPEELQDGWESDVVDTYSWFIEEDREDIGFNGDPLVGQQAFLVEGVLLFGLALPV